MNSNLWVNKFTALFAFSFTGNGSGMALAFVSGEGCRAVYFYGCLSDSCTNFCKYSYSDFLVGCFCKERGGKGNQ